MIFFALLASEGGILLAVLSLYRAITKPDAWSFLVSFPGIVFLSSSIIVAGSGVWMFNTFRRSYGFERKQLVMAIGMNILTLVLMAGSLELLIRIWVVTTKSGETILGTPLLPRSWPGDLASYRTVLERMASRGSFLIYDQILGWTIAPSRQNAASNYFSSTEGLRSSRAGIFLRATNSDVRITGAVWQNACRPDRRLDDVRR